MNETCFLILPLLKVPQSWNWTAIGVIASASISAVMAVVTSISLKTTWNKNSADQQHRNSEFYLEQAKLYLSKAVSILSNKENNNIRWHQAIQLLKIADSLKNSITELPHQHIYLVDYIDAGYEIGEIIKGIDDPNFFYGVEDYRNKDSALLYRISNPSPSVGLGGACPRISPDYLRYLCLFIDTVGKANFDLNENENSAEHVFHSCYFKKPIKTKTGHDFDDFTRSNCKIIFDYISNYEKHAQTM